MLFKNGDCDLVCAGCKLENNPAECLKLIFIDLRKIREARKKLIEPPPEAKKELKKNGIKL